MHFYYFKNLNAGSGRKCHDVTLSNFLHIIKTETFHTDRYQNTWCSIRVKNESSPTIPITNSKSSLPFSKGERKDTIYFALLELGVSTLKCEQQEPKKKAMEKKKDLSTVAISRYERIYVQYSLVCLEF